MKYMLLFCATEADLAEAAKLTPEQLRARYHEVVAWLDRHGDQVLARAQLQGRETATTVALGQDPPVVTDGPFLEGKEGIGGFALIEVADLDEALRMARTWPARGTVEIRPVVVR